MNFGYQPVGSPNGVEIFHDTTIRGRRFAYLDHGKHSIHAGFELYHYIMNDIYAGNQGASGSFTFTGQYTGNDLREPIRQSPAARSPTSCSACPRMFSRANPSTSTFATACSQPSRRTITRLLQPYPQPRSAL